MPFVKKAKKIGFNLASVVDSARVNARAERASRQAELESDFQRAIADGLSYEEQVQFRQEQIEEEKASAFTDKDFVLKLTKSVTSTKKLARFGRYRTTYQKSLQNLSAGKVNEESVLQSLKEMLKVTTDSALRTEMETNITKQETAIKESRDAILSNKVKKAKFDGTANVLQSALSEVQGARLAAQLNGNDDEVTAHDVTLSALQGQLSTTRISDAISDYEVKSVTAGNKTDDKLNFFDAEIGDSNDTAPVRIGNRTYNSEREFWELERNTYLTGESKTFGSFTSEMKQEITDELAGDAVRFGSPTQVSLDTAQATFDGYVARPGLELHIERIRAIQSDVMSRAVDLLAKDVVAKATDNLEFKGGVATLENIQARYNVDTSSYQTGLEKQLLALPEDVFPIEEKRELAPDVEVPTPVVEAPVTTEAPPEPPPEPEAPALPEPTEPAQPPAAVEPPADLTVEPLPPTEEEPPPVQEEEPIAEPVPPPPPPEPTPTPTPEAEPRRATLINRSLPEDDPKRRRVVVVDSDEAQQAFGEGFELET